MTHDAVHAIIAALACDDIDRALDAGLLTVDSCKACSPSCATMLIAARATRLTALAARERYRARAARLLTRQQERSMRRTAASPMAASLPPAAAAALARAKARAAGHG
ncbi:MAG: hypothetical protein ABIP11_00785 [Luteimonas sp.]